jgi:hypothetical protein
MLEADGLWRTGRDVHTVPLDGGAKFVAFIVDGTPHDIAVVGLRLDLVMVMLSTWH